MDKILDEVSSRRLTETVDTVKYGDPSQPVTGILTVFTVTFEVIQKAKELGVNFIITHEPTFYNHYDHTDWLEANPIYEAKLRYIKDSGLTIWRFHDYWHLRKPDGILVGVAQQLGWESYMDPERHAMAVIPRISLGQLAEELKVKMNVPQVRIVGDVTMTCKNIGMLVGAVGGERQIEYLSRDDVDTVICGETVEWSTCEFVRDAVSAGLNKALIIVGHSSSEEAGMSYLANWLKDLLPNNLRIDYFKAGDPIRVI
jgi:putative NIF3 family GTP cyclohydrolase 1 type 2